MNGPRITYASFRPKLASHDRLRLFLDLPEELRREADDHLLYRLGCQRESEYREVAFDRGWNFEEAKRTPPVRPRVEHRGIGAPLEVADDVFDRIPPPVYVEALTGEAVPSGGGTICCPLPAHDDRHPSCRVYGDPGRGWVCFSCNRGGSAIDLASYLTGIEPRGEGYWRLRRWIAERLLVGAVS